MTCSATTLQVVRRGQCQRAADTDLIADKDTAQTRLLDYYLHTAQDADRWLAAHLGATPVPSVTPPAFAPVFPDRDAAVAWLTAERLNVHAAAEAEANAGRATYVADVAVAMHRFLSGHGHWGQAIALDEAALRFATDADDRFREACALALLGSMQRMVDEYPAAADSLERALRLFTDLGERLGQADAQMHIGALKRTMGDLPSAIRPHSRFTATRDTWKAKRPRSTILVRRSSLGATISVRRSSLGATISPLWPPSSRPSTLGDEPGT